MNTVYCLCLVGLGWIMGRIVASLLANLKDDSELIARDESDAEIIANGRNALISNVIATYCDAWDLQPDLIRTEVDVLGFYGASATVFYKNTIMRFYFDWERKTIRIGYISNWEDTHTVKTKTLHYRNLAGVSLEKVYMTLLSYRQHYLKRLQKFLSTLSDEELEEIVKQLDIEPNDSEEEEKMD